MEDDEEKQGPAAGALNDTPPRGRVDTPEGKVAPR